MMASLRLSLVLILLLNSELVQAKGLFLSAESVEATEHGQLLSVSRPAMGTIFTIMTWAKEAQRERSISTINKAFEDLEKYESKISSWRESSDTHRLNTNGYKERIKVGSDLEYLVHKSQFWYQRTNGAFDPGSGHLYKFWSRQNGKLQLPKQEVIDRIRTGGGLAQIDVNQRGILFLQPMVRLDFGGIGKGAAADRIADLLRSSGVSNFVIDAGGDLSVFGRKGNTPWRVGVKDPRRAGTVAVFHGSGSYSLATSGDYERYVEIQGRRFSHIVDPRSGWPVQEIVSATVLADRSVDADALATAVSVLGINEGIKLINERDNTEVLIIDKDGREYLSKGWKRSGYLLQVVGGTP